MEGGGKREGTRGREDWRETEKCGELKRRRWRRYRRCRRRRHLSLSLSLSLPTLPRGNDLGEREPRMARNKRVFAASKQGLNTYKADICVAPDRARRIPRYCTSRLVDFVNYTRPSILTAGETHRCISVGVLPHQSYPRGKYLLSVCLRKFVFLLAIIVSHRRGSRDNNVASLSWSSSSSSSSTTMLAHSSRDSVLPETQPARI